MKNIKRHQILIILPLDEYYKIMTLQRKLRNGPKESQIMTAIELAACFHHFIVKEFPWCFTIDLQKSNLPIMKAFTVEVKEYLDNHNTTYFGFCPMRGDGESVKEELTSLYFKNIYTYNKIV